MRLLIVDAQELIVTEELYEYESFMQSVGRLIAAARKNDVEVIYIRHDDGTELTRGAEGFEIHGAFAPTPGERIFDKHVNSPFRESGLTGYLHSVQENTVIIAGLQTDYCIDAAVKCGFEHGFKIIVPACCNTTVDNEYMTAEQTWRYYNEKMWPGRYAVCISLDATLSMLEG